MTAFSVGTIHTAPEVIWELLTDIPAYEPWNPAVTDSFHQFADGLKAAEDS